MHVAETGKWHAAGAGRWHAAVAGKCIPLGQASSLQLKQTNGKWQRQAGCMPLEQAYSMRQRRAEVGI